MTPIANAIHPRMNATPPTGVIPDGRVPDAEHVRGEAGLEAVRAERAPPDRSRGEQCAEGEEQLQAGFLVFFLTRCGRFLP